VTFIRVANLIRRGERLRPSGNKAACAGSARSALAVAVQNVAPEPRTASWPDQKAANIPSMQRSHTARATADKSRTGPP
jgi:hypothetical protein